jgi:SAM-dependent methyltransferase
LFATTAENAAVPPSPERSAGRRFDRERGVTTHAVLFLRDLDPEAVGDAGAHATHYEAVPVEGFRSLLRALPDDAVRRSTFVDAGAGMGRAVLLALEYPFAQIVGIEISPGLHGIATDNLAKAHLPVRRCADVRLVRADARRYRFPPGDLVVFLYNPFDGEALDAMLDRLAVRRKRGTEYILYHTPVHSDRLTERGYTQVYAGNDMLAVFRPTDSSVAENVAVALPIDIQQDADGGEFGKNGRTAERHERQRNSGDRHDPDRHTDVHEHVKEQDADDAGGEQ